MGDFQSIKTDNQTVVNQDLPFADRKEKIIFEFFQDLSSAQTVSSINNQNQWGGFHKLTPEERKSRLNYSIEKENYHSSTVSLTEPQISYRNNTETDIRFTREHSIENFIQTIELPMGFSIYLNINGFEIAVPMVTEEPSVIAASCNANKIVNFYSATKGYQALYLHGSKKYSTTEAQIHLSNFSHKDNKSIDQILLDINQTHNHLLIQKANSFCPSMVNRGGGVWEISGYSLQNMANTQLSLSHIIIVSIKVNVCDAMGANCVNTIAEGLRPTLETLLNCTSNFSIVTNYCEERVVKASFSLPVQHTACKGMSGEQVSHQIVQLHQWAASDIKRATTHNKGIFNGIDAVAVATGQDWRAIEAAGHAYASRSGKYLPLTKYSISTDETSGNNLSIICSIEIPIPVGIKGGTIHTNPTALYNLSFMRITTAGELAVVMACIGLGQNFAAMRAIATEGIQRGHMKLHTKNLLEIPDSTTALIPPSYRPTVIAIMQEDKCYSSTHAIKIYNLLKSRENSSNLP